MNERPECSLAVASGLPAGALGLDAGPFLLARGRALSTVTGRFSGDRRTSSRHLRSRPPLARPPVPPAGAGRLEPLLAQLRRCLAGEDRDPAARLRQRSFEDFGLHRGTGVLRRRLAAPAVLGD